MKRSSEAAMTASATTAIRIVQIALISGFTPSRTSNQRPVRRRDGPETEA